MIDLLEDTMTLLESTGEKHVREDVNCLELAHDIISCGVLLLKFKNFMIIRITTNCSSNFLLDNLKVCHPRCVESKYNV